VRAFAFLVVLAFAGACAGTQKSTGSMATAGMAQASFVLDKAPA
jgi:hypothetical protein